MRTTSLSAACLLGLALLAPAYSASAAGETCRGEAATIVGTGAPIVGTEGRDVIVTGLSTSVSALGGDDLVCVAFGRLPSSNVISVDTGAGDDVVDSTAAGDGYYVTTTLGAGADTYVGGAASDGVTAGVGSLAQRGPDAEQDVIDTGAGRDSVVTGSSDAVNRDVVRLGPGEDRVALDSTRFGAGAVLDGGADLDRLDAVTGDGDVALDMSLGTLTTSQGTATFTWFEDADLRVGDGTLTYRGTERNDSISVHPASGTPTLDLETLAGQDSIVVEPATITAGSRIDGGIGRNTLLLAHRSGSVDADLGLGTLLIDGQLSALAGIQDVTAYAPDVVLRGDDRGNNLFFSGCTGQLTGGDGRDQLRNVYDSYFESYVFDCRARTTMTGGAGGDRLRGGQGGDRLVGGKGADTIEGRGGNDRIRGNAGADSLDGGEGADDVRGGGGRDRLVGRPGRDTLVGQGGTDTADGSQGRDRCVAERERRCER